MQRCLCYSDRKYSSLFNTDSKKARVAQWWEHLPPTKVAQVQIPASTPYVGWVSCWFSPLLREVFLPSPQKPTLPSSNSIWNALTRLNEFIWTPMCFVGKQAIYNFFYSIECAHCRDVYVIVIGNTVSSLIRTPKGLSIKSVHYRDVYVVEIGNKVSSLIRTPKGHYEECALQRCLCSSRYNKYSKLFNMDSVRNRSQCHRVSLGSIEMSAIKGCSWYRARDCIGLIS